MEHVAEWQFFCTDLHIFCFRMIFDTAMKNWILEDWTLIRSRFLCFVFEFAFVFCICYTRTSPLYQSGRLSAKVLTPWTCFPCFHPYSNKTSFDSIPFYVDDTWYLWMKFWTMLNKYLHLFYLLGELHSKHVCNPNKYFTKEECQQMCEFLPPQANIFSLLGKYFTKPWQSNKYVLWQNNG